MEKMESYLFQLRSDGIDIEVEREELKLKGPQSRLTAKRIEEIKQYKQALLVNAATAKKQYYPLASTQKRLFQAYFTTKESPNNSYTHHLYSLVTLNDHVDLDRLQLCFQQLLATHQILRTGYECRDSYDCQVIWPNVKLNFILEEVQRSELEAWITAKAQTPMNLEQAQVIRVCIANLSDTNENLLLVIVHHIACDFDSLQSIFQFIEQFYTETFLIKNTTPQQFKHIVLGERAERNRSPYEASLRYWQSQIELNKPLFPKSKLEDGASVFVSSSNTLFIELGLPLSQRIFETIKTLSITPHNFFLALFEMLVASKTQQKIFQVGIPISKRQTEHQSMLGSFVDTYWVQANLTEAKDFATLSQNVKMKTLQILPHMHCGFYDLLETLNIPLQGNDFPIFQVSFNWVKAKVNATNSLIKAYHGSRNTGFNTAPYDLMLVTSEENKHIKLCWVYKISALTENDIVTLNAEFKQLIEWVCDYQLLSAIQN